MAALSRAINGGAKGVENNSGEEVIWGSFTRASDGERKGDIY